MYNLKEVVANKPSRFSAGHRMCAGCGAPPVARMILRAVHEDDHVVVSNATGCMEVSTCIYPYTSWEDSYIHTAFECAAATGSGAEAAHVHEHPIHLGTEGRIQLAGQSGFAPHQPYLYRPTAGPGAVYLRTALRLHQHARQRIPLHQHLLAHHQRDAQQLRKPYQRRGRLQGDVCRQRGETTGHGIQIRL